MVLIIISCHLFINLLPVTDASYTTMYDDKASVSGIFIMKNKVVNTTPVKSNSRNKGSKNGLWKGDNASYNALHTWVHRNKPKPLTCECCRKEKKIEAANISGEYKRDISDWEWLCRKCHMSKDGRAAAIVERNRAGKPDKLSEDQLKENARIRRAKFRQDHPEKIKEAKRRYYDKHIRKK